MISIIMASYGNIEKTKICYNSIMETTDYPYELIYINQQSPEKECREWASTINHPNVKLYMPEENLGLVKARNYGIKNRNSDTEYVVFFDNDIYAPKNWASRMVDFMNKHKEIGISGPATNFAGNSQMIEGLEKIELKDIDLIEKRSASVKNRKPEFHYMPKNFPIVGFSMFIPNQVIESVGLFDENIEGEWDDTDYCRRIEKQNLKLACIDNLYIHHWGHSSWSVKGSQYNHDNHEKTRKYIEKKWGWV